MRDVSLRVTKALEGCTVIASIIGIVITLIHGKLYDYFFNLFSIGAELNFRILYVSVFEYSALALAVFTALFLLNEKNPKKRWFGYVQGWLFIAMACASFEWFDGMLLWGIQSSLSNQFSNQPDFHVKGASVIFFGALFIFWILEIKKKQVDEGLKLEVNVR